MKAEKLSFSQAQNTKSIVDTTPVLDVHTHIYDSNFGKLLLWGIDDLLTYHYLIAEVFRVAPISYDRFWAMSKSEQADYIWKHLFIERSPLSEASRGVVTLLNELNFDSTDRNLDTIREFFTDITIEEYIDLVFEKAGVREVIMTNDPFDESERLVWEGELKRDKRFRAALRIDRLLTDWDKACNDLVSWGYEVEKRLGDWTLSEIRRFISDWVKIMKPAYMAASLPPTFTYPDVSPCGRIIDNCILPVGKEYGLPFSMMIGVKKQVNPHLKLAGDSIGKADISALERLCSEHHHNKFLVTMLSRENQHELCVTARKFSNLMIFGCWWFLNNPSIMEEITRERLELLGLSMIPQHSDARILDQLIYKWKHSRKVIADVLADKYAGLVEAGWKINENDVKRDVEQLFGGIFDQFVGKENRVT
ncbi:MAG TPA: glucuronate isomerase [Anaerolineae bacterium]|nr:glucuronate isomerase [Anaerolineae bacterium]